MQHFRQTINSTKFFSLIVIFSFLGYIAGKILLSVHAAEINTVDIQTIVYVPLIVQSSNEFTESRQVNAPYINGVAREHIDEAGIFWFGRVTPVENYVDIRVGYDDSGLVVHANIFDRYLWYDVDPTENDLINWDAVSLFINNSEFPDNVPDENAYHFVAQLNHWQPRGDYQAVYQGNGITWETIDIPFVTETSWRGDGLNDSTKYAKGWTAIFTIPFSSLGYSNPPNNETWRIGMALHDRDDSNGTSIMDKTWPELFNPDNPVSWGRLHFGLPTFSSSGIADNVTVVRNGDNGVVVKDGHVGGEFDCGADVSHFSEWGNTNYETGSASQINIQNQWDVSDWPCFSKYYISFPLDDIPIGSMIITATLTMYHFGDAGAGYTPGAQPSIIQILTTIDEWEDNTITWNNAPLAYENVSRTGVDPLVITPSWPGEPVIWDVSKAVNDAHLLGNRLQLVLYSSDNARHSGKYFYSSNSNSDGSARPLLTIFWESP